jgi:hypothetical protein
MNEPENKDSTELSIDDLDQVVGGVAQVGLNVIQKAPLGEKGGPKGPAGQGFGGTSPEGTGF